MKFTLIGHIYCFLFVFHYYTSRNAIQARKLGSDLGRRIILNTMKQPMEFFDRSKSGELSSYCGEKISDFVSFWLLDIPQLAANIVIACGVLYILFKINTAMSLVQLISIPLLLFPTRYLGKTMGDHIKKIWEYQAASDHIVNESFVGIRFVKAACLEDYRMSLLEKNHNEVNKIWGKVVARERLMGDWAQGLIASAFNGLAFATGALYVIRGKLTVGALIAFISYVPRIYSVATNIGQANLQFNKRVIQHERAFEFLSLPNEESLYDQIEKTDYDFSSVDISFDNVHFKYPTSDRETLRGISLTVRQGEFVGIVGPSGVGKSTIFDLLLKFYEPQEGCIYLNDMDFANIPPKVLRQTIALVSQDIFLFAGTLRENLLAVKPSATEEELLKALEVANFVPVLEDMPEGLYTYIGENGMKLSGDERQRVALARALLMDSKVLLLDEVTSNLDAASQDAIASAIHNIIDSRKVTVISISHRMSFLQDASWILVLNDGKISKIGT